MPSALNTDDFTFYIDGSEFGLADVGLDNQATNRWSWHDTNVTATMLLRVSYTGSSVVAQDGLIGRLNWNRW